MEKIYQIIDKLTDDQKAEMSAKILNECNPNLQTLTKFFESLEDTVRGELIARAVEIDV